MDRHVRDEELLADVLRQTRRSVKDVQRPTGTEKARTTELAQQLEGELGPLPGQVQEALNEAAEALAEAGLARTEAGQAVADAQQAVADSSQAITDAVAAIGMATAADSKAVAAQSAADQAQTDANQAATDALAAANAAATADGKATSAQTTANSKGKVIIQNAAPAAADQLAQNLWIDTTGGANTPKRWNGSVWVVVTDKAATDAAAAAVTAQTRADNAFTAATNAATAAGAAQTTADGKNRVWYLATAPAGTGHKVDDVWFNTAQGYRVARWSGSAWEVTQFGTQAIANLAITNALIANATIQDAKIANLDAGKITSGFVAAARLEANSITAEKIAVAATNNLIWDGAYTAYNSDAWNNPTGGPGSAWSTEVVRPGMSISQKFTERTVPASTASMYSAMRSGVNFTTGARTERLVYVGDRVGEKITAYSHWYVDKTPPTGMTSVSSQIYFYNAAGLQFGNLIGGRVNRADVPVGEWFRVGGTHVTVPAGALYAIIRPTVYYTNNTTAVNGTNYYLGGEEMYWADAGELIVDGGILANHISALAVTAEKLAANAVTAVKIAADAVTAEKINAGAVTTDKLNALAVTAEKIAAGAIIADKIAAGAITTAKLAATAIDGMTITGALIRTAASGQRLQMDVNGLRSFNSSGTQTAALTAYDGGLNISGLMRIANSSGTYPRTDLAREVVITELAPDGSGNQQRAGHVQGSVFSEFKLQAATPEAAGYAIAALDTYMSYGQVGTTFRPVSSPGFAEARARLTARSDYAGLLLYALGGEYTEFQQLPDGELWVGGSGNARINFTTPVAFQGDTDWVYPTLLAGTVVSGNAFGYCRRNGVVWLTGRIQCADGDTIFNMPAGFRILGGQDNVRLLDRGGAARVNFKDNGDIQVISGGNPASGVSYAGTSYVAAS